eukprot:TRINITY_DN4969_c0_g1_i2.p1 TRINITY_DN4969_c0_g1~~TRINITY_DN4969_c0_g1_i2.p1  ORF type:complete len:180 (-),score=28.50 TRINITY_DN4969_c0_g1_i2:34-573(-)
MKVWLLLVFFSLSILGVPNPLPTPGFIVYDYGDSGLTAISTQCSVDQEYFTFNSTHLTEYRCVDAQCENCPTFETTPSTSETYPVTDLSTLKTQDWWVKSTYSVYENCTGDTIQMSAYPPGCLEDEHTSFIVICDATTVKAKVCHLGGCRNDCQDTNSIVLGTCIPVNHRGLVTTCQVR